MGSLGLSISPGFLLLSAALYYFGGGAALAALLTAALAHELGHLAAIRLCGAAVRRIRLTASGPVIVYAGSLSAGQEAGIAAAGPIAGLLLSTACFLADTLYFRYVGAASLLATAFNLLPVPGMDGGRVAEYLLGSVFSYTAAENILRVTGTVCALGVTATGIAIRSPAAAAAGVWMSVLANCPDLR